MKSAFTQGDLCEADLLIRLKEIGLSAWTIQKVRVHVVCHDCPRIAQYAVNWNP